MAATSNSSALSGNFKVPVAGGTKARATGGGAEWFTRGRFALLLAACIFAAYPEVVLGVRTFFFRDFGFFGYPLAFHHRESFWRGEIPLWNPLSDCGLPFLAQWNTLVLYPGSLLYLLLPLSWSMGIFCLLHQFLGGLGMYVLATRWTQNRLAASLAGMVFAFNGLALNCLMWPNNIAALGWMPWVVLQVERAGSEGGRQTVLAALFGAMQMLAGAPEIILFTWAVLLITLAFRKLSLWRESRFLIKRSLSVVLVVTGLTAAQLLPFVDLLAHSQRDTGYAQSTWSMPGTGWANFFIPLFHCFSSPANQDVFFQYDQWWTSSYYAGVGPLVLAVFGVWRLREPRVWLLGVLAALAAVLALGDNGYLYKWARQAVPQFGLLRYPIKFVVVVIFCLPLLAAFALARFPARETDDFSPYRLALCLSGAITLAAMMGVLWFAWYFPFRWDDWPETCKNALARATCFTVFLLLLLSAQSTAKLYVRRLLQVALLLLTWLDLVTHAPRQNPTVPRAALEPRLLRLSPGPAVGLSRAMISPAADATFRRESVSEGFNRYILNRLGLFSNCNLLEDIPKVNGFFSLYLRETDQVCSLLYPQRPADLPHLIDFLNVSHITAPGKLFDWTVRTNYLPFVTAGQRPVFENETNILRAVTAPEFSPGHVVYLPAEAQPFVTARETPARTESIRFSDHRGEIVVEAAAAALAVVSQSYYHPWKVRVDGQPARLWRANHAFQAVEVPAGRHAVQFVYRDTLFISGTIVSMLTLAGCLIGGFRKCKGACKPSKIDRPLS
jgi:hypothetical protein